MLQLQTRLLATTWCDCGSVPFLGGGGHLLHEGHGLVLSCCIFDGVEHSSNYSR